MRFIEYLFATLVRYGHWVYSFAIVLLLFSFIVEPGKYRTVLISSSSALFLIDFILSMGWLRVRRDERITRRTQMSTLIVYGLGLIAVLIYLLRANIEVSIDNASGAGSSLVERLQLLLLFLLTIVAIGSAIYRIALSSSQRYRRLTSDNIQVERQNYLMRAAISTSIVVFVLVFINYFTFLRNPSIDLSPGFLSFTENSKRILRSVDHPVSIYAFLPERQAVSRKINTFSRPELYTIATNLRLILEQVPLINENLQLKITNADFTGSDTSEFEGISNGVVLLRAYHQDDTEQERPYIERRLYIFDKDDMARFEKDFMKAILFISTPVKKIYFTALNGEKVTLQSDQNAASGIKEFKKKLALYNATTLSLDRKSDWPLSIPKDADALFVIGPTRPFSGQARQALVDYLQTGGKVFITIDPEGNEDFSWLLALFGNETYGFRKDIVVNSKLRGLLVTNEFSSHPITRNLYQEDDFLVFGKSGYFEKLSPVEAKKATSRIAVNRLKAVLEKESSANQENFIIKKAEEFQAKEVLFSPYDSFVDVNNNNQADSAEPQAKRTLFLSYALQKNSDGQASEQNKEESSSQQTPKLLIASSTVWLNDWSLRYPLQHKNIVFATDIYFWFIETPLLAAIYEPEIEDRDIVLDGKNKWKILFFGLLLFPLMLALLLAVTIHVYRKKRKNPTVHVLEE